MTTDEQPTIVIKGYGQHKTIAYGAAQGAIEPPPAIAKEEIAAILATGFVPQDNDWEKDPDYISANAAYERALRIKVHLHNTGAELWKDNTISAVERSAMSAAIRSAQEAEVETHKAMMETRRVAKKRTEALVAAYRRPFIEERTRELLEQADEASR